MHQQAERKSLQWDTIRSRSINPIWLTPVTMWKLQLLYSHKIPLYVPNDPVTVYLRPFEAYIRGDSSITSLWHQIRSNPIWQNFPNTKLCNKIMQTTFFKAFKILLDHVRWHARHLTCNSWVFKMTPLLSQVTIMTISMIMTTITLSSLQKREYLQTHSKFTEL